MSLADELARLESLRVSGAITYEQFEHSKSRLLDACVRRIEAVHEAKAPAPPRQEPAPVKAAVHGTVQHIRFLPPDDDQQFSASPSKDSRAGAQQPFVPPKIRRAENNVSRGEIFQEPKASASPHRETPPAARSTAPTIRLSPPDVHKPYAAAVGAGQRAEAGTSYLKESGAAVQRRFEPPENRALRDSVRVGAALPHREAPPNETAPDPAQYVRFALREDQQQHDASVNVVPGVEGRSSSSPDSSASTQEPSAQAKNPPLDDCRLFEAFYDRKPPFFARWGLPPVRVVCGVVQNIDVSRRNGDGPYAASVEVDGQRVEIDSPSSTGIAAGDRVALGGYERDGRLLALAYHNESKGAHSDLRRLRNGYRFLLAIGWVSLLAGIAAIAVTGILLVLHRRTGAVGPGLWGYVPYALSGLGAAAVSYFGVGLSFLGVRAREFHDAMASSAPRAVNPS